ncbi:MAG: hypothetical protein DSM106950_22870 [Stigonema ocellatum SAG 48.90 = DSM 106950]|nr:hypothetical protein [Stigonema ocellatum SAG 48.90 = DSM 106950]
MEHWEFLIQKQGDRTWRTLKSPIVEIMEGRYRVVARSNRANLDVDVRVTHSSDVGLPPKRRIHKRSRRTNLEGLMVVIPFTYLNPGIWELRCSGDLMSVLLGISWQYSVHVRVLPMLALGEIVEQGKPFDEISPTSLTLRTSPASSALNSLHLAKQDDEAIINEPVSPVWLKAETAEQILKDLIELALPRSESLLLDETTVENSLPAIPELPLLLILEQETYVARWGETLTINGQVDLKPTTSPVLDETLDSGRVCAGELRIELCSPQGSEVLTQVRQPLRAKLLPLTIKCSLEIPSDWESKVILADIRLYGALAAAEEVRLLAHQSFTITADVTQLLAISTAANKIGYSVTSTAPEPPVPIKLELFNLVKTPKKTQPLQLHPSPNKILPPQIAPREPDKTAASLQLPNLTQDKTKTISTAIVVSQPPIQVHNLVKRHAVSLQLPNLPPPTVKTTSTETVVFQPSIQVHDLENHDIAMSPVTTISTTFPYLRRIKPIRKKSAFNWQLGTRSGVVGDSTEYQGVEQRVRPVLQLPTISPTPLASPQQSQTPVAHDEDAHELVTPIDVQSQDNLSTAGVIESISELINVGNAQLSPLIKKWMRSQGHSLPEPINVSEQNQDDENNLIKSQETLSFELKSPPRHADVALEVIDVTVEEGTRDRGQGIGDWGLGTGDWDSNPNQIVTLETDDTTVITDLTDVITALTDLADELFLSPTDESSVTDVTTNTPSYTKIARTRLAEEIVVYDTYSEVEAGAFKHPFQQHEQSVSEVWEITEPLLIPQLHLPNGELVSGQSIRVFVQLPDRRPQVAVRIWVEDCQTRWLLDGPRLLTNLLPNSLGGLEVMTHINVPFGCLEIRVEAIAVDMATQQESHKVSIQRTVIPPDLPNLPIDELLLRI